jgi:hypothetical protein
MLPDSDPCSLDAKRCQSNEHNTSTNILNQIEDNSFPAADYYNWQETAISGVLQNVESFGDGWWYRLQLADDVLNCDAFERSRAHCRPLRAFAKSWFPLPKNTYHVVWAPQWVPAASVSEDLKIAFWNRMPSKFWSLANSFDEDMVWREEVERYVCLSRNFSKHLCTRRVCTRCGIVPDSPTIVD